MKTSNILQLCLLCLKLIYFCKNIFPNIYTPLYSQALRTVELSQPVSKISHANAVILNITGVERQTSIKSADNSPRWASRWPNWTKPAPTRNNFYINNITFDGPNQCLAYCHQLPCSYPRDKMSHFVQINLLICLEVTYFYACFCENPHVTFSNSKEPQKTSTLSKVQAQNTLCF